VAAKHDGWILEIELISDFISAGRRRMLEDQMFQSPSSHAFLLSKPFDDDDLAIFRVCEIRVLDEDEISIPHVPFDHGVSADPGGEKAWAVCSFSGHVAVSDAVPKFMLGR
jgi:hypothetical protein